MATSRICSIEGCGKPHWAKGFCGTHYRRFERTGDPMKVRKWGGWGLAEVKRLMSIETDDCVFFTGVKPYGHLRMENKIDRSLPSIVALLTHGPAPSPKHMGAHSCGNGHLNCVNKRHVRWATAKENSEDRSKHGRATGQKPRLTSGEVATIKRLLLDGEKRRVLGDRFGVTVVNIGLIATGRTWRHIEPATVAG